MRAGMQVLQPREIVLCITRNDRILAGERRIPHDRVEARILSCEYLRKFDLPMKGLDWMVTGTKLACESLQAWPYFLRPAISPASHSGSAAKVSSGDHRYAVNQIPTLDGWLAGCG